MTKTELQIAEENIKHRESCRGVNYPNQQRWEDISKSHQSSCERFLEFLVRHEIEIRVLNGTTPSWLIEEITDLKQAIKLYSENGI